MEKSQDTDFNEDTANKKLSYRRGTARRAVSVETVRNVAKYSLNSI